MFNENNLLIVCPNEVKLKILRELEKDDNFYDVKFMTKSEFMNNYYFNYTLEALYYLVNKYNYSIDVAKVYLDNLKVIDINKNYQSDKLKFLAMLKKELIENNLLIFNNNFKEYLSTRKIKVVNYFDLDKYEEEALNYTVKVASVSLNKKVLECKSLEDEVNYVCIQIIKLLNRGVDINKIFLTNVSNDYLYTIKKIFKYYNIPINIDFKDSIYSTKVVSDYLNTSEINLNNKDYNNINRSLINILGELSFISKDNLLYNKFLKYRLKNTYLKPVYKTNSVNIKDLYKNIFDDDEYVFVLGFNQDSLPKMEKDIKYINDEIKNEVSMYTTTEINKREKEIVKYLLGNIKNLYLSYKLSSPFSSFYKSSLINDLGLEVVYDYNDDYKYSNIYNKLRLGEKLDLLNLYGERSDYLELLNNTYTIPYKEYSNKFTGINNDLYLKNLSYPLKLSYTSLNNYNECRFKYYVKNVLKLDVYTDTFAAFIGSLYHNILALSKKDNFNFEEEFSKYLETRDLSLKEKVLLVKIKKDLLLLLEVLKKQQLLTGYDDVLCEAYTEVDLRDDIAVKFIGYIDKIMFYKKMDDTYFSIIDYKSGFIDTHIEPMKYGLHMQLPIYLYLIHYSKLFSNPIFTGIYYQNILFNYPSYSEKLEKEKKDRYLLQGYSTDIIENLERFDTTYYDSQYIKSMKYNEEKGFGTYSKVISNDTLYDLVKFTKKHIEEKTEEILKGDFSIDPKVYAGTNVACQFCKFKDLCYMKDEDLVYLEKQDDLSFLGGDL